VEERENGRRTGNGGRLERFREGLGSGLNTDEREEREKTRYTFSEPTRGPPKL